MNLLLCFSFNVALKDWFEKGFLDREINYYENLSLRSGINITFLTYGDDLDFNYLPSNSKINVIPIFSKKKRSKYKIINFFRSISYLIQNKDLFAKYDLFKTNQNYGSWLGVLLKIIHKKKLISRGGYDLFHFSILKKNPIKILISYLVCLFIYKNSDLIFVPTLFYKTFIKKYFFIKNNVFLIPNYIDTNVFTPTISNKSLKKILFVGRLVKQKNIINILKAFSNTDFSIDILGSGPEKKKIINYIKRKKVKVNFLKNIPNSKMPDLYNQYHFFILFSLYEGNPKTLLEAMSCGLCVIGSNSPGINNVISKNNGLILNLSDYFNIPIQLNKIINTNLLNHIKINARDHIISKYSINNIIQEEIYQIKKL